MKSCGNTRLWPILLACLFWTACANKESADEGSVTRLVKRLRQVKFKPETFAFTKIQVQEGEQDGLLGTCLHVPMRDANQHVYDCDIGITLPIYVRNEKWPRDNDDATRYVTRAANAVRKHVLSFTHADAFTCSAYYRQIQAYLSDGTKRQRETWKGANTFRCHTFKGPHLPDFISALRC